MPPKAKPSQATLFKILVQACKDGDLAKATQIVADGANVNKKNPDNVSPLFLATEHKHQPIVAFLLSKGANVDEKNGPTGISALYKACYNGSLDIVTTLVDAGANVNFKSLTGFTLLYVAVQNEHKQVVEYLLSKGVNVDEKNTESGYTALYLACDSGSLDIAKILVDAGANVNLKTNEDYSPLFNSVRSKNLLLVEYLLSKGAVIDEKNGKIGLTPLYKACYDGSLDIATVLVDAGADINLKSTEGFAPLCVAVQNKHKHIVEYLLTKGAIVDVKCGDRKWSPLVKACYDGLLDIANVLVDAGADLNQKTREGYSLLYIAVQNKHKPIVEYLLSKGAPINEKNGLNDDSALHKACFIGSLEMTKTLIEAGADINILDKIGQKPIDLAIGQNHQAVVEYLESLQPQPQWTGFTQSDISKFDTIFETEAPAGQAPPAANYACCPVCLKFVERSDACMYMSHKCTGYYHKELRAKYSNPEGFIYWCTICGRICFGHRHYPQTAWNAPKPDLLPPGAPFDNDCKKNNGGGGLEEKLARFRALRNTAYDLQTALDAGEMITVNEAMNELVQQCWQAVPGAVTKRIMTQKAWNRPTTNFLPNATAAHEYPKNDPSAYEAPRILSPGNANFEENAYTSDDSQPVIQFKHKKADGSMHAHPFLNKETLLMFINSSGPDWPCFDPACGGHLWPAEVIQALENPVLAATAEEKAKGQAYKERVHGSPQTAGRRCGRKTQRRRRH